MRAIIGTRCFIALLIILFTMLPLTAAAQIAKSDWDRYVVAAHLAAGQGDFAEAEKQANNALDFAKRLSEDDYRLASTYTLFGDLYRKEHKLAEAEKAYARALPLWKQVYGPERSDIVPHLNNLADVYVEQQRYAAAEPLLQQSLAINEKVFDRKGVFVANSVDRLAALYCSQQKLSQAEGLYRRSLALKEDAFGRENAEVANAMRVYARVLRDLKRYSEADELEARATSILKRF